MCVNKLGTNFPQYAHEINFMNSTSLVYCSSEMTQDLVYLIDPFTTLSYILAKEGVVKMNLKIILKKSVFITKINGKK